MKTLKKGLVLCLCLLLILSCIPAAFAAEVGTATIDTSRTCSLTIYKYDFTGAYKDGIWNHDSFSSTGWTESYVQETLGNAVRKGNQEGVVGNTLGNSLNSNGYSIAGVEFTTLKIADIVTFSESVQNQTVYNTSQVLYRFLKDKTADFLKAIGLQGGVKRFTDTDDNPNYDSEKYFFYTSDVIIKALADALSADATGVKNAMEAYVSANGGVAMALTDENGKTSVTDLPIGLYLTVETKVPEAVTHMTAPFLVSLPMTTVTGDSHSDSPAGGTEWNYDVVLYPKNETGIPSIEKTVREAKDSTGKNGGTTAIADGFAHNATASSSDMLEYQVVTSLPTITSDATGLSTYYFYDTIAEGIHYNQSLKDVKMEIFSDKECTNSVAVWVQDDGRFTVEYTPDGRHMTVDITSKGLEEINGRKQGLQHTDYSNHTIRLTYSATVVPGKALVLGQDGNANQIVLTWQRSSTDYYDTLIDDCHVYSFGINLTKLFSDKSPEAADAEGLYQSVKFKVFNKTDNYWVAAARDDESGIYYVKNHEALEQDATALEPVKSGEKFGQIMIAGLEDDEYVITEITTADGYTLLRDNIHVTITSADDSSRPCNIYSKDVLGVMQNDPHYDFYQKEDLKLANIPQAHLSHNYLTASAKVDGNAVTMLSHTYRNPDEMNSTNAVAPLTVVNTEGYDLPETGDSGVWMYGFVGMVVMGIAIVVLLAMKKKENSVQ